MLNLLLECNMFDEVFPAFKKLIHLQRAWLRNMLWSSKFLIVNNDHNNRMLVAILDDHCIYICVVFFVWSHFNELEPATEVNAFKWKQLLLENVCDAIFVNMRFKE